MNCILLQVDLGVEEKQMIYTHEWPYTTSLHLFLKIIFHLDQALPLMEHSRQDNIILTYIMTMEWI